MILLEKVKNLWTAGGERARVETEPASTPVPEWVKPKSEPEPLTEASIFCALADKFESGEWLWIQDNEWINGERPRACIWGGMRNLAKDDGALLDAATRRFGRVVGFNSIVGWNDAPTRTYVQVIKTLRRVGDCATP